MGRVTVTCCERPRQKTLSWADIIQNPGVYRPLDVDPSDQTRLVVIAPPYDTEMGAVLYLYCGAVHAAAQSWRDFLFERVDERIVVEVTG